MQLTILGSGTAVPVAHRGPSGSWVHTAATSILVDCGSGVVQKLVKAGGDLRLLDAVLLTHAHLDHIGDLLTLLFGLKAMKHERTEPLEIVHSRPLTPYLDDLRATFGRWLVPEHTAIRWRAVEPGASWSIGDLSVESFAVDHHDTSLGYRIAEPSGVELAIPADTGLCQSLIDAVTGVDAVLIECSKTDDDAVTGHLCPADVGVILCEAQPKAAILTHQYPEAEEADVVAQVRSSAPCPVWEARDGLTMEISPTGVRQVASDPGFEVPASDTAFPDEATPLSVSGDPEDEAEAIREMMEAHLAGLDEDDLQRAKFARESDDAPARTKRSFRSPRRRWTVDTLRGLRPNREQSELLSGVAKRTDLPVVNLRGESRDTAMLQLRAALQTWSSQRLDFGRVVTGKGKQSENEPVIKLAVLNWLDSDDGRRWIRGWAPELTRDGSFGSVVVALR